MRQFGRPFTKTPFSPVPAPLACTAASASIAAEPSRRSIARTQWSALRARPTAAQTHCKAAIVRKRAGRGRNKHSTARRRWACGAHKAQENARSPRASRWRRRARLARCGAQGAQGVRAQCEVLLPARSSSTLQPHAARLSPVTPPAALPLTAQSLPLAAAAPFGQMTPPATHAYSIWRCRNCCAAYRLPASASAPASGACVRALLAQRPQSHPRRARA